ncbi:MAG: M13 family metallopeptidase [Blautia sp.]|nr:M13 family metallopeptidase [Blautia sp.]
MNMVKKGIALLLGVTIGLTPVMANEATAFSGGTPWVDTDLKVNIPETEEGLSPKDDFNLYVNYEWLKNAEIEQGRSGVDHFSEVGDAVREQIYTLLEAEGAGLHETELVRQYYKAYLDWDSRNADGVEPLRPYIEKVASISNLTELTAVLTDPEMLLVLNPAVNGGNATDFLDSSRYTFQLSEASLSLGDPAEYENRTDMGERKYQALKVYMENSLPKFGYSLQEADSILDGCIAYETILAENAYSFEQQMSPTFIPEISQNAMSYEELIAGTKNFPTDGLFKAIGYDGIENVLLVNPDYYETVDANYTDENLELMKDHLIVGILANYGSYMDRDTMNAALDYRNTVSGSTGYPSDQELAGNAVTNALSFALDRAYVDFYNLTDTRERITALCETVRDEYREMLAQEEWLTETTRQKAIEKLDAMKLNAVYPDKWRDYSTLDLTGKSLLEMMLAIGRCELERNAGYTNGTVDKDLWIRSTTEVNAYYDPQKNSINIMAGILGGVFYQEDMTDEALYGGIGMVIAHEISHAFDPAGSQYDKEGNLDSWWTEEDLAAYVEKAAKLISYYDTIEPWTGIHCTGSSLQGEVVADLGGVKCMLSIIQKEGLDPKAFFESYGRIWAAIHTSEMEETLIRFDTHPLGYLRTNVILQQYQEFYDTYDVQEGDGMYLAPEDRIVVW